MLVSNDGSAVWGYFFMICVRWLESDLRTPPKVAVVTPSGAPGVAEVSPPKKFLGCILFCQRNGIGCHSPWCEFLEAKI